MDQVAGTTVLTGRVIDQAHLHGLIQPVPVDAMINTSQHNLRRADESSGPSRMSRTRRSGAYH